jgi:protein tyrosine/serine phosphatase
MSTSQAVVAFLLGCVGILVSEGCATSNYTHGVPNLVQVRPDVWRSGQPVTTDAWDYLERLGIRHVLKLDFDDEGSDTEAVLRGMEVVSIPLEPTTKAGFIDLVEDVFAKPSAESMESLQLILGRIKYERGTTGGWLVHCKNGHDRTGLVVGMIRLVVDGWDKHHAWSGPSTTSP